MEPEIIRHAAVYMDNDILVDTTQEDYEDFCAGVMLYSKVLGLTDWSISFYLDELDESIPASVNCNYAVRDAAFTLNTKIYKHLHIDATMMMRLALHEVLHVLFAEIGAIAALEDQFFNQRLELIRIAEHGIIRRLEDVLLSIKCKSDDYRLVRVS